MDRRQFLGAAALVPFAGTALAGVSTPPALPANRPFKQVCCIFFTKHPVTKTPLQKHIQVLACTYGDLPNISLKSDSYFGDGVPVLTYGLSFRDEARRRHDHVVINIYPNGELSLVGKAEPPQGAFHQYQYSTDLLKVYIHHMDTPCCTIVWDEIKRNNPWMRTQEAFDRLEVRHNEDRGYHVINWTA